MNLPQKFELYRLSELASAAKQLDVHPITASSMQEMLSISWMRSLLVAPTISGDVMQQLMIVLQWYRNNKRTLTTNTDRSWKNIYEEAKEWARYQDQLMQREALYWYSDIDKFRVGDYEIVPLTSSEDLLEEGFYMSHCVGDLAYSCIDETLRVFSLRDSRTGKRIATISITNDWYDAGEDDDSMHEDMEQSFGDGWRVDQVYGYANSAAPKAVHDLASFIAFSYPS